MLFFPHVLLDYLSFLYMTSDVVHLTLEDISIIILCIFVFLTVRDAVDQ